MPHLLHIDSSARTGVRGEVAHGSYTRSLSQRFVQHWQQHTHGEARTSYRDLAVHAPRPVSQDWIAAAFTASEQRPPAMADTLAESDCLVAELRAADVVVIGAPMYNFGPPATLKAWIDNVVRIRETFDFLPARDDPYVPLLADRPRSVVLLTSRGSSGLNPGQANAGLNHLDPMLFAALGLLGITDSHTIAIEHEETGGPALAQSVAQAMQAVDVLAQQMASTRTQYRATQAVG